MAIPTGSYNKRKIRIILPLSGKFVPIHLASGRHRATYLAEYCRVGKITHRFAVLGQATGY